MSTLLPAVLWVVGAIDALIGVYSLVASLRYRRYVRRVDANGIPPGDGEFPWPSVLLVVPCCGDEDGLEANLAALLTQDYPALHVRFVVESASDAAVSTIERLLERHPGKGDLVVAGPARTSSQKVRNLLVALESAPGCDVFAFADSDGRPEADWMRRLVHPLERPGVGAASSYRFYLQEQAEPASFATLLRSVWNASVLTLLGDHDRNFAWGGSMAMRREVFERIGVTRSWESALSDDYALTHAVRRAGLKVEFVPGALVASPGSVGFFELLSWCARQISITRVYWPALFRIAAITHGLYAGFLLLVPFAGSSLLLGLAVVVLALGFVSGGLRARALAELAPRWQPHLERHFWAYVFFVPLASFLTLFGVARALCSRRIEWRGRVYEMRSPTETVIVEE